MVNIMFNFFADADSRMGSLYSITGQDFNHIKNVLRLHLGDTILISENSTSNLCRISSFEDNAVMLEIIEEDYQNTELEAKIYLFQGLPKSDKMELIIQKTVELGVFEIIPTEMSRCVVKIEDKKKKSKTERWQAIAESAAKQSKRNIIPKVHEVMTWKNALEKAKELDIVLVPYEAQHGMLDTKKAINELKPGKSIGIFIGPEGGFDSKEAEALKEIGGHIISLGKRILRTETAAITSVSMCMLHIENLTDGE